MFVTLPFVNLIILFLISVNSRNDYGPITNCRIAYLKACILLGSIILFLTEILSVFDKVSKIYLTLSWIVILIILSIIIWYKMNNNSLMKFSEFKSQLFNVGKQIDPSYKRLINISIIFIVLPTLFLTIYVSPNTWDAMTYHLSRVEHWIQNNNVEFYPTPNLRQLFHQPFSEYCILHLRILSGSDYFTNFVQFFSMIGSIIALSLIGKLLGLNYKGQIFTSIIGISLPMGILQSTSSQNDYVATFFFVCFVLFGLYSFTLFKYTTILFSSISLGLAVITKAYVYIYALPFLVWFGIVVVIKNRKNFVLSFLILIICCSLTNISYFYRNYNLTGYIFGPKNISESMVNESITIKNTISNIIRNTAVQIGLPIEPYNLFVKQSILASHEFLDIDMNNEGTTWSEFNLRFIAHEDEVGSLLVVFSFILSIIIFTINNKRYNMSEINVVFYVLSLIFGFMLFSAVFKWQPWVSRFLLGLFISTSPFIAYTIMKIFYRKIRLILIFNYIFLFSSMPFVYGNWSKPIISAQDIVKKTIKHLPSPIPFQEFDATLKKCSSIERSLLLDLYQRKNEYYIRRFENYNKISQLILSEKFDSSPNEQEINGYIILLKYGLIKYNRSILKSRYMNYFNNRPRLYESFDDASKLILKKDISKIGLIQGASDYEYPFWCLINKGQNVVSFKHLYYPDFLKKTINYYSDWDVEVLIITEFSGIDLDEILKNIDKTIIESYIIENIDSAGREFKIRVAFLNAG